MKHRAAPTFWFCYRRLPKTVRRQADACYALLRQNPRHPSLRLKKIGRFWSVRIGRSYRALAIEDAGDLLWFWIGIHGDYDKLITRP